MNSDWMDKDIVHKIERDRLLLQITKERAEEIVRDRGWSEADEDFDIQVEQEARRQWNEEMDRQMERDIWTLMNAR